MRPQISIIVPVYNVASYVQQCLDSILDQTFKGFEVIVINDGSTDNTGEIIDKYTKKDRRVKAIHQSYGGVSSARNIGIELATGEYIGFVDGDDYIKKDMFETLYRMCVDTESDIAICRLGRKIDDNIINNTVEPLYTKELDKEEAMCELFKGILYRFSLCNKLFKKSCFQGISFPVGRIHEDLATTYRLFDQAK